MPPTSIKLSTAIAIVTGTRISPCRKPFDMTAQVPPTAEYVTAITPTVMIVGRRLNRKITIRKTERL